MQDDEQGNLLEPWRPKVVYHYIQDRNLKADFVIDISKYMDKKFECILAFKSQFNLESYEGPKTPISGREFMDYMKSKNQSYGRDINADYAEGFTVDRTIGVQNLFDLI